MNQLTIDLQLKATRPRDMPAIDRLHAIIKRSGIEIYQRSGPSQAGAVLVPPSLARPRGVWALQCASPAWAHAWPWSRHGYSDRAGKQNQNREGAA
jgi:hypothetical protein